MKKSTIFMIIIDIIGIAIYIVVYGPYTSFRDFFVTTAMGTKTHTYLARVFYSEETITDVLGENTTTEIEEETETSAIVFNNEELDVYDSIYDEQILKRDPGNNDYKIIEFKENGYTVYLTVIYDPSRVSTMMSKTYGSRGEYLSRMAKDNGAIIGINGGGFIDIGGKGDGAHANLIFISNGKIIESNNGYKAPIIGMNKDNVLVLAHMSAKQAIEAGIRDAVCFGPFLIVNGKAASITGNGGYGVAPRTVIAQRKDGVMLFLTIDGSGNKYGFRGGASMNQLIDILKRYGAYNAANLDGGASTVLAVNGKLYNHPVAYSSSGERGLPNGWMFK